MKATVKKTNSGIFVRADKGLGLLAFSPYTGLIYAIHASQAREAIDWLERRRKEPPEETYRSSLGVGWDTNFSEARFLSPHLLP